MPAGLGDAAEPALVDRVGDEAAEVGVHPPALVEEHAAVAGDVGLPVEEVLQAGSAGVAGVVALGHLGELHLVADENEIAGREPDGHRVRQGELSGLVDDEVVEPAAELLPAEGPRGAADQDRPVAQDAGRILGLDRLDRAALR